MSNYDNFKTKAFLRSSIIRILYPSESGMIYLIFFKVVDPYEHKVAKVLQSCQSHTQSRQNRRLKMESVDRAILIDFSLMEYSEVILLDFSDK